jgi:hypothetical protein
MVDIERIAVKAPGRRRMHDEVFAAIRFILCIADKTRSQWNELAEHLG